MSETPSQDVSATMCVWCEERVCGACKSHYDTLTCTHRVFVPTAEQWDAAVEARAAERNEGKSNAAHWHQRATTAEAEVAQARQTAEYWKAEHLAGNARIGELHDELAATALRSADHLRKAIKAEAEVVLLRTALNGGNVIERLQFALQRLADAADTLGVNHFGDDWLSDEVQELQAATHAARLALGPNVSHEPHSAAREDDR